MPVSWAIRIAPSRYSMSYFVRFRHDSPWSPMPPRFRGKPKPTLITDQRRRLSMQCCAARLEGNELPVGNDNLPLDYGRHRPSGHREVLRGRVVGGMAQIRCMHLPDRLRVPMHHVRVTSGRDRPFRG